MKLKKLIIILAICVIIISSILLVILKFQKKLIEETPPDTGYTNVPESINESLQEVKERDAFYAVKTCIGKFYSYYSDIFKNPTDGYLIEPDPADAIDSEGIQKNRIEKVYKMLDEEYLAFKGLTVENLVDKLPEIGEATMHIEKMFVAEKQSNISVYFVYGKQIHTVSSTATDFSIIVKLDTKSKTFKVLLKDYLEYYYKDVSLGQNINIKVSEIKNEAYNTFSYQNITDEEYVNDLFANYKNILKTNKEKSYDLIDEKYKTQIFANLEEYLTYVNTNYLKIVNAEIKAFSKTIDDEYNQYLLRDNEGSYYIFNETAPFQYTVMLDNYTIPTNIFIEEYNKSSGAEKVVLNIKKFFMGIDDKNYTYSYGVLSESFKNNKYPTENDFINYAKQNFFEKNEIEYINYKTENDLYIYQIKLKDATGNSAEEKSFNMIVKLNSGTDFEMSFGQ